MEQTAPKKRGTIILDSCALIHMGKIGVDLRSTFVALSQHGFDVLIPETIAVECSRVLANGTDLNKFFDSNKYNDGVIKLLIESATTQYKNYDLPYLNIVQQTGPKDADDYCSALQKSTEGNPSADDARKIVAAADRDFKKKNLGDEAILSLATKLRTRKSKDNLPIFVITNDHALRERLNSKRIENLSSTCFCYHLNETNIDKALGLKPTQQNNTSERNQHFRGSLRGIHKEITDEREQGTPHDHGQRRFIARYGNKEFGRKVSVGGR